MQKTAIIPSIGLGTWKLRGDECEKIVKEALEIGYRHIDTADMYENHRAIGRAIRGVEREKIFLATKLLMLELLPSQVDKAVPRFLRDLQVDYLDLLLIHWPNPDVDMAETLRAMVEFKEKGLVRNIGVSNFVRFHLEALEPFHFPIITNQIEMHPYLQRRLLVETCKRMGIEVTAYRPLAKGAFEKDTTLQKIGKAHGKSPSQIALKWLVQQDIAVIPKASSLEHLKTNFDIFDFQLTSEEMEAIRQLDSGERYCAPEGYPTYED